MVIALEEDDNGTKEETRKAIEKFNEEMTEEAKQRLEEVWDKIFNDAIANCPVDSGALVSSIHQEDSPNVEGVEDIGASYSLESGAKAVSIMNGTIIAGDESITNDKGVPTSQYASYVHDGHFSGNTWVPEQPFLTDAIDAHFDELMEAIDNAIKSKGAE